mgnify:CR=1 FL=1
MQIPNELESDNESDILPAVRNSNSWVNLHHLHVSSPRIYATGKNLSGAGTYVLSQVGVGGLGVVRMR